MGWDRSVNMTLRVMQQDFEIQRCSKSETIFVFFTQGKQTPAFIRCQERRRLARSRQHKAKLAAEEERLHDVAVESELESEPFMSATPSPSPPLPPPILPPRAVRRLTMDKNQADSPPP